MIHVIQNSIKITEPQMRKPKGFFFYPYPPHTVFRYLLNRYSNGLFSYKNPDAASMNLLRKTDSIAISDSESSPSKSLCMAFLGDIMTSRDGKPPMITTALQQKLQVADIIIANVEAPVVAAGKTQQRGLSLKFAMGADYLKKIYQSNSEAKWVFNTANNHACDGNSDVVENTARQIYNHIPNAEVIGVEGPENGYSVLQLRLDDFKVGLIGWTDVMNNDAKHAKQKSGQQVVRGDDLSPEKVAKIKQDLDFLIGFAHGNEEQSYHPIKLTRNRWASMCGETGFDVIIGHGPHVLQQAEKVNNRILFNSIGNFCSPIGCSQTKVGAAPFISLNYGKNGVDSIEFDANLIQQIEGIGVDVMGRNSQDARMDSRIKTLFAL